MKHSLFREALLVGSMVATMLVVGEAAAFSGTQVANNVTPEVSKKLVQAQTVRR